MDYYYLEGREFNLDQLTAGPMPSKVYREAHAGLVLLCHDIFIQYNGGILLVKRLEFPAKGLLWPIGGRVERGVYMEESLRNKVLEETGMSITNVIELGHARIFSSTDPFGHGKGTDAVAFVYFGIGHGQLKLNNQHESPTIVSPSNYEMDMGNLHPYVRHFMDLAIPIVRS